MSADPTRGPNDPKAPSTPQPSPPRVRVAWWVVASVVAAFFYIRVLVLMYMQEPQDDVTVLVLRALDRVPAAGTGAPQPEAVAAK